MTSSEPMPATWWKKMWQWNTQRPSAPPGVTPSICGRSSALNRYVRVAPEGTSTLSTNSGGNVAVVPPDVNETGWNENPCMWNGWCSAESLDTCSWTVSPTRTYRAEFSFGLAV